jgi:hypothetical protein
VHIVNEGVLTTTKRRIGWVIFISGTLLTCAFFLGGFILFFASSCESGEAQTGGQAFGFVIAAMGIPFYFVARYGWRLSRQESSKTPFSRPQAPSTRKELDFDPNEKVLTIINVVGGRALFFTSNRIIVANTNEEAPIWTMPFTLLSGSASSHSKLGKVKKLKPDLIFMNDPLNYFISYSILQSIRFYKKGIGRKIEIVADNAAISFHPRSTVMRGMFNNRFEFWLSWPWGWKKYESALSSVLQGKLIFS